ncbi:MAG: tRNA epoxyqueuosine(34) reductase QueG [Pseudomonadota bacterium]|nr:tRNA epoxyqueuosine(34) reductase QueG [Pseudomonadota bacterium]
MKIWSQELGFQQIGFSNIKLSQAEKNLQKWLDMDFHGEMHYMEKHGKKRSRPEILVPKTLSIISVRMDYLSVSKEINKNLLDHPKKAYISRYALGRDYHKVLRKRLKILGTKISEAVTSLGYRVFVDSAPVLEKPIAEKAGLGWIGKHTNLINKESGSFFFLGEIYTDLSLPFKKANSNHCGSCTTCIDICPTKAIVAPYVLDARKCISYLTIELKGSIPEKYRKLIGNRIYGCDDCQIFCPWNKFAKKSAIKDFSPRHQLDSLELIEAFLWDKDTWQKKTEGTAIRRISHEQWLRNVAVALGNAKKSNRLMIALESKRNSDSIIVKEHVEWAIQQHS